MAKVSTNEKGTEVQKGSTEEWVYYKLFLLAIHKLYYEGEKLTFCRSNNSGNSIGLES